jgi:hypothetical protein
MASPRNFPPRQRQGPGCNIRPPWAGGNHFIEIGVNSTSHVGIVIHSGSSNPA